MEKKVAVIAIECKFGPASAYAYYIDAKKPILIDTGVHASAKKEIVEVLIANGKTLADVQFILLTHGHVDHLGGAYGVWEATNFQAQVIVPEKDAYLLADRQQHIRDYEALQGKFFDDAKSQQHIEMLMQDIGPNIDRFNTVEDGATIDCGDVQLEVIETPGHSNGSVTYFIEQFGWAFAADAVQIFGGVRSGVPAIEQPDLYRQSIQRLQQLQPTRLYLGHHFRDAHGQITNYCIEGKQVQDVLQQSLQLDEKIRALITTHNVSGFVNEDSLGRYGSFTTIAHALGYEGDPTFLPCAFYVTIDSYVQSVILKH